MKKITAKIDLGTRQTFEKCNGKFLDESAYTEVITVTEDTAILKPVATLEGEIPLAYIITDAYPNNRVRDVLMSIEDSSTMRANCSGPIDKKDMESKGLIEGRDYKLRTPNSYHVRTSKGGWGMLAYSNEINSVMIGYKRGRFTGAIDSSGWTKDNPEKFEILKDLALYNERAFEKANPEIYKRQKAFSESFIKPEHRIGIFTTLSANRYHIGQTKQMSAHVDSGDTDAGLTTMCLFREGDYSGGFLVFPQFGVAIDAPSHSVIIADSNSAHGVSAISGNGQRFTCVAYTDRRLSSIGVFGKGEKLIGKYAQKESGSLEDFLS